MNEFYTYAEILGKPEDLVVLGKTYFNYYSKERIPEVLEEIRNQKTELCCPPIRNTNGTDPIDISYEESLIERFSDEDGGYYYKKNEKWDDWIGGGGDSDIIFVNPYHLHMRIACRTDGGPDFILTMSREYPDSAFYVNMGIEHDFGRFLCVMRAGTYVIYEKTEEVIPEQSIAQYCSGRRAIRQESFMLRYAPERRNNY